MSRVEIRAFSLGMWATNCYVIHPRREPGQGPGRCTVVDCGFGPSRLIAYVREHGLVPDKVVLTHAHLDHIAGLTDMRRAFPDVAILIHRNEREFLTNPELNLSIRLDTPVTAPPATGWLEEGQTVSMGGVDFEIRATPGHSPGSVSLYQPDLGVVFAGDALFAGSIGRTDFPGSDTETLLRSIQDKLFSLPDATRVLPGHGQATTIGTERQSNPFLADRVRG